MINQSTIDKLIEMRLTAMADAFRIQMDDPAMKEVPFEDRFGMLVYLHSIWLLRLCRVVLLPEMILIRYQVHPLLQPIDF